MDNSSLQSDLNKIVKYCVKTKSDSCDTVFRFCKSAKNINPLLIQRLHSMLDQDADPVYRRYTGSAVVLANDGVVNGMKGGSNFNEKICNPQIVDLMLISMSYDLKGELYTKCFEATTNGNFDFTVSEDISIMYIHADSSAEFKKFKLTIGNNVQQRMDDGIFKLSVVVKDSAKPIFCWIYYNILNDVFIDDYDKAHGPMIQTSYSKTKTTQIIDMLNGTIDQNRLNLLSSTLNHYKTSQKDRTIVMLDNDDDIWATFKYSYEDSNSSDIFRISYYDIIDKQLTRFEIAFDTINKKFVEDTVSQESMF